MAGANTRDGLAKVSYLPGFAPLPASAEGVAAAEPSGQDERLRAEHLSMKALTRRGMSRCELEGLLLSSGLEASVVENELDRLERVGLIDDIGLAETIVRTQHERKGLSRTALRAQLRRRGIDDNHSAEALDQLDDADEQRAAVRLAVKRAAQLGSLAHETAVRRLTGYLLRRGYPSSTIRAAVDEALPRKSDGVRFR